MAKAANGNVTSVAGSDTAVNLLEENRYRAGFGVYNDSTATLYLSLGEDASSTNFTVKMDQDDYFEHAPETVFTGRVSGIWASATGSARITEWQ